MIKFKLKWSLNRNHCFNASFLVDINQLRSKSWFSFIHFLILIFIYLFIFLDNLNFCDFEDAALCNYTQLPTDDFDWTWSSGRTPTFLTGPNSDHTMGTKYGHYMYIESSNRKPKQRAHLMSEKYNTTDTKCLHFYYYMYGDHVDELNVYTVNGRHFSEVGVPIWSRKYNQGPKWIEGQTSIFPGSNYHVSWHEFYVYSVTMFIWHSKWIKWCQFWEIDIQFSA